MGILSNALTALQRISEADPQSDTCGSAAPEICENGCIGCIARAAILLGGQGSHPRKWQCDSCKTIYVEDMPLEDCSCGCSSFTFVTREES